MGLSSTVDLIVATLDLKEVQSVISAMRAADAQAAASVGGFGPAATFEPRPVIHPEPRYEPRPVIHPTPRYEPRPVIHPTPRVEAKNLACDCNMPSKEVTVCKPPSEQPLQPPWKTVPWENTVQAAPKVKVTRCHPDIIHKGMLLDFFV